MRDRAVLLLPVAKGLARGLALSDALALLNETGGGGGGGGGGEEGGGGGREGEGFVYSKRRLLLRSVAKGLARRLALTDARALLRKTEEEEEEDEKVLYTVNYDCCSGLSLKV